MGLGGCNSLPIIISSVASPEGFARNVVLFLGCVIGFIEVLMLVCVIDRLIVSDGSRI